MARSQIYLEDRLAEYLTSVSLRDSDLFRRLREETAEFAGDRAGMQVSPEQGQFLALLVKLLSAKKALEVGVFTGYSSLSVALALPPEGQLVACDISETFTSIARKYWKEAGVAQKVDLRIGPALDTLDTLIAQGHAGSFDFAFIDADKGNYANYYNRALTLLRPGGLIVIDNVFWHLRVIDPSATDEDTLAIRRFNSSLHEDDRVEISMIPLGDGLTLARKLG